MFIQISLGDVRQKKYRCLINVKNIDGNLKNFKNVFRIILIMTNMYVKVKTHMEGLKLNFYTLSKILGFFVGYFSFLGGMFFMR